MDYHLISSRNPYRNHRDSLIRMFGWRFNRFVPFHFLGPDKDSYWSTLHYNHIMESNKVISHDISFQVCGIIRSAETLYFPTPFPLSPWCSLQILWGAVSSFSVISQEPRKKVKTTNMLLLLASTSRELREKIDETPEFIMIYLHCVLWLKKKPPQILDPPPSPQRFIQWTYGHGWCSLKYKSRLRMRKIRVSDMDCTYDPYASTRPNGFILITRPKLHIYAHR